MPNTVTALDVQSSDEAVEETSHDLSNTYLRHIRGITMGLLGIGILSLLYFGRDFFVPVTLAFILALTFSPVVRSLKKFGIPEAASAFIIVISLLAITVSAIYLMALPITEWFNRAPEIGTALRDKLSSFVTPIQVVMEAEKEMSEVAQTVGSNVIPVTVEGPGFFATAASSMFGAATSIAVMLVLLTFLLASGEFFYAQLMQTYDTLADKKHALGLARDVERVISRYLLTIATINICLGIAVGVMMYLAGMPTPYVWGAMAALLNFMPYIGAIIGLLIVAAVAVVTFDGIYQVLLVVGLYFACTSIEGQFVTPVTVGRKLNLNTAIVFIAVAFWAWLWGIVGALLAVPLLVIFKTIAESTNGESKWTAFFSSPHPS